MLLGGILQVPEHFRADSMLVGRFAWHFRGAVVEVATWRLEQHYGLALLSAASVSGTGFLAKMW